jgi:CRISPR-associated endonuclease/helicase Cas3
MMVTFVSQCEKKALARTRRVLDAFADRIGDNTWQTVITEEGLLAVKKLLRHTASKNTAVSCHWMRSRSRSELLWVVGRRNAFNNRGLVPVNSTNKNNTNPQCENDWQYLPLIKALVAVSALLHDWGKASVLFQSKLTKSTRLGDPLRHEWVSCLLLNALVNQAGSGDRGWLELLISGEFNEIMLMDEVAKNTVKPLDNLPLLAQWVAWLIVTHHRLPSLNGKDEYETYSGCGRQDMGAILKSICAKWGYQNTFDDKNCEKRLAECLTFSHGLLSNSSPWKKSIKKWATRLRDMQPLSEEAQSSGAWRLVLQHARLCLMLGDHYYSSCDKDSKWSSELELFANTERSNGELKQRLDEHLVRVSEHALNISQYLTRFTTEMPPAHDVVSLNKKSPAGFVWQDVATQKISTFKQSNPVFKQTNPERNGGWFIINMASTGCGKTIANAKIMRALSNDGQSLRFILALGLRTLTLQTGDEYRKNVGLGKDELAVLVGSSAVKELHEKNQENGLLKPNTANTPELTNEELGSESADFLLDEELDFEEAPTATFLSAIIPPKDGKKNKAFLYKPVLVCTIDHIMAATETKRGGRYILPYLRLLSSDLVIDEVDDFDGKDLIAIARLVHLAGMLGRKVMISSATIPPALAEGFFNAYQEGWRIHQSFKNADASVACVWVDEFSTTVNVSLPQQSVERCASYKMHHESFVQSRVKKIIEAETKVIKRKAKIVNCEDIISGEDSVDKKIHYFERIRQTILDLHEEHHSIDPTTGKRVSFGVVRMANTPPCVALSRYLLNADWEVGNSPKVMAYHSRQVLLLRSHQEHHLEQVLKRKESPGQPPKAFGNPIIRKLLDQAASRNVIFILVATPVEEVGRDHDFDWAVIEPSSYRSVIQLAGRVRRHRQTGVETPNIALMQYNVKGLRQDDKTVFCRPGFETNALRLSHHNLDALVDESQINQSINAIARITTPPALDARLRLADLEHHVIAKNLTNYKEKGPESLQAWLTHFWWLTALPQQCNRFRGSMPDSSVYRVWQNGKEFFCEKDERGSFLKEDSGKLASCAWRLDVEEAAPLSQKAQSRLWLARNYEAVLREHCGTMLNEFQHLRTEEQEESLRRASQRYGEITVPEGWNDRFEYSDDFGLVVKR